MGIFNSYWNRLRRYADRTLLRQVLIAVAFVALAFALFACYLFKEKSLLCASPKCCFENKAILFFSLPGTQSLSPLFLPLLQFTGIKDISYVEVETEGKKWKATALKTDNIGDLLAEFSKELVKESFLPLISIVLDKNGAEYLLLVGSEGQISLSSMKFLAENFLVDIKGKPSVAVHLPHEWGYKGKTLFYLEIFRERFIKAH